MRSDSEYILMGKIMEKEQELFDLLKELHILSKRDEEVSSLEVQTPSAEVIVRKPISDESILKIIDNDEDLVKEISSGRYKSVRWGSGTYVASWSKGRKYDPSNNKISGLRSCLRRGVNTVRGLSSHSGLALNTVKDLVKEMDKQGFFSNT